MRQSWRVLLWAAVGVCGGLSAGCGGGDPLEPSRAQPVVERYVALVRENYTEVVERARALEVAVNDLVAAPSEARLVAARSAWVAARPPYGQSEAFRFYGGPIDDERTNPEGRINGWPLDESYIDGVQGAAQAGIINAPGTYPQLTEELLGSLNERGGETNIATGYHAIEFLLWGQDLSDTGPGNRPYTDFVDGGTAPNAARRREYLAHVTHLLVRDLEAVAAEWQPDADNYARRFTELPRREAVLHMLTGLGRLSGLELSGERMAVAYENRDQEDEHSCFSDNTLADLYANALGIQNVYLGRYGDQDGPGLDTLVAAINPELDRRMKERIEASLAALQAIPAPFDQALLASESSPNRQRIREAIVALRAQTDTTAEVAEALGLKLNLE